MFQRPADIRIIHDQCRFGDFQFQQLGRQLIRSQYLFNLVFEPGNR